MLKQAALLFSTLFFLASCEPKRVAVPLPIPPERMDCVAIEEGRPAIPPEYVIDWGRVASVGEARAQHEAYVQRLRLRENQVAGYLVRVEGRVFACADDAAWLRDYTSRLP